MTIDLTRDHAIIVKALSKELKMSENEAAANLMQTALEFIEILGHKEADKTMHLTIDYMYRVQGSEQAKKMVKLINGILAPDGRPDAIQKH